MQDSSMSTNIVLLRDPNVEPTGAQLDAIARAALRKVLQRREAAEQRFEQSLERSVKRALADKEQRRRVATLKLG
jgi:hypothetical protein